METQVIPEMVGRLLTSPTVREHDPDLEMLQIRDIRSIRSPVVSIRLSRAAFSSPKC